jgi:hypothetical protein|tara:strand:- start:3663 stop:4367 length:705 start_codon:yes stop_codon:yes gene_type:complete
MEEEKNPDLSSLHYPVSDFLWFNSDEYKGYARVNGNPESFSASANLVPKNPELPDASISAQGGRNALTTVSGSVGLDLLRYAKRFENIPKEEGGPRTTDTVEGSVGPLTGFYEESSQPGNQGSRTTAYGGKFDFNLPGVPGALAGGLSRRSTTGQPEATSADLKYAGQVGRGILSLQGNLTDFKNVGTEKSFGGSYDVDDPFGLGGNASATASYIKPPVGKSAAEAMLRYKRSF